jgi:hypothetical protein
MTIAVSLKVDKPTPASGETVTASYAVTGLSPVAGTLSGNVTIAGKTYPVTALLGDTVTYAAPTMPGLTFKVTADPAVFTAQVP